MTIAISCGQCGGAFQAPDQYAGRQAKCPKCKSPIVVGQAAKRPALPDMVPPARPAATPMWDLSIQNAVASRAVDHEPAEPVVVHAEPATAERKQKSRKKGTMRPSVVGYGLIFLGFMGAGYFAIVFDTSVASEFGRVQNISLAQCQTLGFVASVGLILFGRTPVVVTLDE